MDSDTNEFLKKHLDNEKNNDHKVLAMASFLTSESIGMTSIIKKSYEYDEKVGDHLFAVLIMSIVLISSKSNDEALARLDKVYAQSRKEIIELDTEVIKNLNTKS